MAANSQCEELSEEVASSKIFVVGAGGIGCEILKDLLIAGFRDISVIDLDTIECSNLNRQFLFRTEHVGMSKAKVAATTALRYAPCFPPRKVEVKPFHASITDPTFDVDFIKRFRLVVSALDNADARSHVNRLCLATNTPMIDCGTRGRVGQVTVILKAKTECYDCLPRPAEQQYASCTIRNTPSQPIHCIIWSKFLFNQLFGLADDSEDVSPEETDATAADNYELSEEATDSGNAADLKMQQWTSKLRQTFRKYATIVNYDPKRILERVVKLVDLTVNEPGTQWTNWLDREEKPWNLLQCIAVAVDSLRSLKKRLDALGDDACLTWDKDDDVAVDFITAFTNLRSHAFHLPILSRFEISSLAGKIVPAVATANAVIAGLATMKAIELLKGEKLEISAVLLKEMKMRSPDVYFVSPSGASQILSSEPGELDEIKEKTLKQCGINHGSRLTCKDFDMDYGAELLVLNSEDIDGSDYLLERYDKSLENEGEPLAKKSRMEEVLSVPVNC
ncbi:ubiquitin activating enzyme E1 [Trichuris trichiura]|uniref:Ubiquitin activating enzyme E1 n=1 Tax=Trichuris trichiura TaxID=36087 RepID=A0A077ZJV0_TRITR|nr:ubiquitin activating enzyme E1 [Trichuris trichiura]